MAFASIRNQCCPNPSCAPPEEIRRSVVVHGLNPLRFRCTNCGKTWVAHYGNFRYGLRSDPEKVSFALSFLKTGMSVRKVAKRLAVDPSTVQRWKFRKNYTFVR